MLVTPFVSKKEYTFLSLFSGCGGFDDGFEQNGFKSLGAYDIDDSAIEVYKNNLRGPVSKLDLSQKQNRKFDFKPGEIDVVISGSPCQGFSTAGKRVINDPRNGLLLAGGEIAISLKPKFFIAENVMGSLSGEHYNYWLHLEKKLKRNGYSTKFIKINCADIGLPQIRKRVLLIAVKSKANAEIEFSCSSVPTTLHDALKNIQGLPNQQDLVQIKDSDLNIIKNIRPGQKLSNVRGGDRSIHTWEIPKVFGKVSKKEIAILETLMDLRRKNRIRNYGDADPISIQVISSYLKKDVKKDIDNLIAKGYIRHLKDKVDLSQTFNGLYRRMNWNSPCHTVDTRFGNPRFFVHPEENRGFTVREAARIQGFRDDFVFTGSIANMFKMIGNAVPPVLSNIIASEIKSKLDGTLSAKNPPLVS